MQKFILLSISFLFAACVSSAEPTAAPTVRESAGAAATATAPPSAVPATAPATPADVAPTDAVPETEPPAGPDDEGLSGRLLIIRYKAEGNELAEFDLASGQVTPVFQAPQNSFLSAAAASPDGEQTLLAYSPPPADETPQYGYTDLYLMPSDGSGPLQPFLLRKGVEEIFFTPTWAPDGQSIYYSHFYNADPDQQVPDYKYTIERASLNGETELLIQDALWPAVSPDGAQLAYLSYDEVTFSNELYTASIDGGGKTPVLQPGLNPPVDAHLYTADGKSLIFSMVNLQFAPASSWLEKLLGVKVASAHSVPSDWYIVPAGGGQPQRLTAINDVGMFADLSPDGTRMAFISATGLYVMNVDGSELEQISNEILVGTVDWLP
jgi:hypothetical protein